MPGLDAVAAVVALSTTVLPLLEATVLELLATVLLTVADVTVSTAHAGDDSAVASATRNMPVFFCMFPRLEPICSSHHGLTTPAHIDNTAFIERRWNTG